ncbi:MAG: isoprenylcysteine carboxylmethyltransferase family protein [Verrucomicrobia bacterium]|nr:isoprenylcysteine carboxylmethyltransferase family protein [Verrucomicrobiota bacterium]
MLNYLKVLGFMAMMIAILFMSAGRWNLPFVWATVGIYVAFMTINVFLMAPDLLQERLRPGPGGKDRSERVFLIPVIVAQWVVAGLDVGRFHWSDTVPANLQIASLVGFALGLCLTGWAMQANRFFSSVVRIQEDRGHHLVTGGPYRYVRHPGYLGGMLASVSGTLALGSWWALTPTAIFVVFFFRRILIEDRFLQEQLAGYRDYAQSVRYRLVPGVW